MKAKDVKVGECYGCKVSGRVVEVRITGTVERFGRNPNGRTHYLAVNLETGRKIEIRSPQRLRQSAVACMTCRKAPGSFVVRECGGKSHVACAKCAAAMRALGQNYPASNYAGATFTATEA